MTAEHLTLSASPPGGRLSWIAEHHGGGCAHALGFREAPGGVHLSKTMMLAELTAVMDAVSAGKSPHDAVLFDNGIPVFVDPRGDGHPTTAIIARASAG